MRHVVRAVHHSRRVYANGDIVDNNVAHGDLAFHIEYNTVMRFGCALFIDGRCVHEGYLDKADCDKIERDWKKRPVRPTVADDKYK